MSLMEDRRMTYADLQRFDGAAELINGRIVPIPPDGFRPNLIAGNIVISLRDHCKASGRGEVGTVGLGYAVPELRSGRESFSTDVGYYDGPLPENDMDFMPGPPTLAVEIRNEWDYGPRAESEQAAKRVDYFEAGTLMVWDVDTLAGCIRTYRPDTFDRPTLFQAGEIADAEPAVPGWHIAVDEVFDTG